MSFSPTDSKIYAALFSDDKIAAIFSDAHFVRYLLAVEAALAQVQGRLGVIPTLAAGQIVSATETLTVDLSQLQQGTAQAGLPIIELIRQIRQQVTAASGSAEAAGYVHWGATTQDIMDTALVLQARDALAELEAKLAALINNLADLAAKHRATLMAGRTHAQQALPIPFGLKVAAWLAPLLRHRQRLAQLKPRLFVVQFGGAAGTLASLAEAGIAVQAGLAAELGLNVPPLPWHAQRDSLAELAGWLSLVSGSLAKLGQDVILLAQSEVGELRESADEGRGGSSTMPQKSNPVISELIVAAARTNAALLGAMHQALVQEHERASHGWQIEWLTLPQMVALTATALNKALFLSENLVVEAGRMGQNVAASNGLMLAERLNFALAGHMGRVEAKRIIAAACRTALAQNRHLVEVVREITQAPLDWAALKDETAYFGSATTFIDQVLAEAGNVK